VKIGVAMATWNGARFVEAQLASIAAQTRLPDQVVVADDGSSDETIALVERSGLPVDVLTGDGRLGVTANFERAIRAVQADVIVLADQDDVWRADKLAVLEDAFRAGANGVFSDGRVVDRDGQPTGRTLWQSFGYDGSADLLSILLKKNVVTGATLAFTSAMRDLVLPIGHDGWHDSWIALLIAATGSLVAIPDTLIDYRVHGDNAEGLGTRSASAAIAQRAEGRKQRELRQFEALADRLHNDVLDEKVEHLRHRLSLPDNSVRRALRIGQLLPEYARYSASWKSPLLDLVAPEGQS
jgi:glycosyltransferase involved in cell wall biosynthesis